jgi:lipopolysaccharide export LptBFGC system permease protein LptF
MVYQLMFPIFFLGALSFMFSTVIRNGNGTAVVMVVIGMAFWVAGETLSKSKWNLFLNPFRVPDQVTAAAWSGIVYQNRIMLAVGSVIAILWGLYNLQNREKFI